jgi:tetratricopeptide (TPR) repeat protein
LATPEKSSFEAEVAAAIAASERKDIVGALAVWERIKTGFPQQAIGYMGAGSALRLIGRADEADAEFAQAVALFPRDERLAVEYAWTAHYRGDWSEAVARWKSLGEHFPNTFDASFGLGVALRQLSRYEEADTAFAEALRHTPDSESAMFNRAEIATLQRNWTEALRRWEDVTKRFHGRPEGYAGACRALCELGQYDEAEAILAPIMRLFADNAEVAILGARLAVWRQDAEAAETRWAAVRERFAGEIVGFTEAALALGRAGRLAEAEALLAEAQERFPKDCGVVIDRARLLQQKGDLAEAIAILDRLRDRFPDEPQIPIEAAQILWKAARLDDAAAMVAKALERFPDNIGLRQIHAQSAERQRDWDEAKRRWRDFQRRFPGEVGGYAGLGAALREAGDFEESESVLGSGLERFPGQFDLEIQRAVTATGKRDWPTALGRWDDLRRRYPRHESVRFWVKTALSHARQDLGAAGGDDAKPAFEIPPGLLREELDATGLAALFMQFESLGDTCEFGIVQRRFGAEPLSLLRWSSTNPHSLTHALNNRLEGVGDPENTILDESAGEYNTRDRRYHMFSHTFMPVTSAPREKFFVEQCRRMQFLRRKLIEDLAAGAKIFVYKSESGLTDEEIANLHQAVRQYGPTRLLCVRLADAQHEPGMIEQIARDLVVGYIDRFSTIDISVDHWVTICRHTLELSGDPPELFSGFL